MADKDYFLHSSSIVDEGADIGAGTKIWHFSHIMSDSRIGRDCVIGQNVLVAPKVEVGNGCRIQNNVSLYTGVYCADDVFLGPSCVFTNVLNPRAFISRKDEFRTTRIGRGASIGANATIVCGVSIGEYALVGAGAVVIEDIPDYALVVGNPAQQKGWISRAGIRLSFDEKGIAVCSQTNEQYELSDGQVYLKEV